MITYEQAYRIVRAIYRRTSSDQTQEITAALAKEFGSCAWTEALDAQLMEWKPKDGDKK